MVDALSKNSLSGLYLIPTPIGNLKDMTLRALEILQAVDMIACEDKRVSKVLLDHYNIHKPLLTYHEYNAETQRPRILADLEKGASIALISDAGTPLLADPGYKLVQACYEAQIPVTALPGATALIPALCISGIAPVPFHFLGFPPPKSKARQTFFGEAKALKGTLIFYESVHRIQASLQDLLTVLEDRNICVARELTKKFEEIIRGPITTVLERLEGHTHVKGEFVVVVEAAKELQAPGPALEPLIKALLPTCSPRQCSALLQPYFPLSRNELYTQILSVKKRYEEE